MRLQLVGPLVVFAIVLFAETAAYALGSAPTSEFLWYLNLEVFAVLRKNRIFLSYYCDLPFSQVLLVAGPMVLIGLLGLALRNVFLVAVSSHVCFVFAALLLYGWKGWTSYETATASLASVRIPAAGGGFHLVIVLSLASFVSLALSHVTYFNRFRARLG